MMAFSFRQSHQYTSATWTLSVLADTCARVTTGELPRHRLADQLLRVVGKLVGLTIPSASAAFTGWQTHLSCGGNKLDTCPLNHLDFIIHATACNPFVWRAAGCIIPCRVSTTPQLLYCITLQPVFHLLGGKKEKGHCLIPTPTLLPRRGHLPPCFPSLS